MTNNEFELRIERKGKRVNLVVYQILASSRGPKAVRMGSMPYSKLPAVANLVLPVLRRGGNKVTELSQSQTKAFGLEEDDAVMLALLFDAIAPLSRIDRIDAIARGIDNMHPVYRSYWFGLFGSNKRAKKALRILLAE